MSTSHISSQSDISHLDQLEDLNTSANLPSRNRRMTPTYVTSADATDARVRFARTKLSKNVQAQEDGSVLVRPEADLDDIAAIVRDGAASTYKDLREGPETSRKQQLINEKYAVLAYQQHAAVACMDLAALAAHGYSFSPEEAAFKNLTARQAYLAVLDASSEAYSRAAHFAGDMLRLISEAEAAASATTKAAKA